MKKEILMLYLLFLVLISPAVLAARLHGVIYNPYLEKLDKAIVEVSTLPKQTIVTTDGSYTFNLPEGNYVITAYSEGKEYSTSENVTITSEGEFNVDLILFNDFSQEEELTKEEIDIPELTSVSTIWTYVLIAWLVIVFVILYLMRSAKKLGADLDSELDQIVKFIKESGGRITQKDIRKKFPWSEAKVSLIITELEDKKLIKKIKKGRTNVIILEH